ncbi:MAG: c-type cytochrome [Planctomycetes bacterium]|nr:c-type cytochrome [Planctomycetota bacterium]
MIAIVIVLVAVALAVKSFCPCCNVPAESGAVSVDGAKPRADDSGEVVHLTASIPGEGELTSEQIEAWLADKSNHVEFTPELPLGLSLGEAEIKGLDANPLTPAKIELGRQLYFDTRLSADNTVSCASCHDPDNGYAKDTQFGVGIDGQEGGRNSPVAYNRIFSGPQFWDGRAESLEAQAVGPIANPIEMGNTHEACVETLKGIEGYQKQFAAVFEDGVTIDNVGRAIASFERMILTGPSPWDYYQELATFEKAYADDIADLEELKDEDEELYDDYMARKKASDAHPISESAARGGELFFSDKAGCTACHVGANFSDEKYHNLGVGMAAEEPDVGRFAVTNDDKDRGAFKTPTVRNVSLTAPYMHDGSQNTLLEVVEWYAKGGHPNEHLSEKVKKLELSEQDKQDLVAFMAEGLLGEFPEVETGRLPQ